MLLPVVLAQAGPRDLTPRNAMACTDFADPDEFGSWNSLKSLRRVLLPPGDIELRYWGGFHWGTSGLRLRRHSGRWSAMSLEMGPRAKPKPLFPPELDWPAFWKRAENLGVWTLPDENTARGKALADPVQDGYSTLVQYQRNGLYRAYAYNNPVPLGRLPESRKMSALDDLIRSQFPFFVSQKRDRLPSRPHD